MVTADLRVEYKNKDKTRSGRVTWQTYQNLEVIEAVNERDLDNVFRRTYNDKSLSREDSEKFIDAENVSYEVMDEERFQRMARESEIQLMMSGRTIIAKEWLQFAKNVSPDAFVETDNECCYYQLSKFLNNPPSNKEQKSFKYGSDKFKTDKEGLFKFFSIIADGSQNYPNFNIKSGVSTEMVVKLCVALGRSCYAYDGGNKCFAKCVINNKNYCPVAFYKYNGHMYLISDKDCFKSITESNKPNISIKTSTVETQTEENCDSKLNIEYVTNFDISTAKDAESKLYIISKSNLFEELKQYIITYKSEPIVKTKEGKVL